MNALIIFKKELKSYFNSPIAYIVIIAFLLISGWFFSSRLFLLNQADTTSFFEIAPFILIFFAPAISMRLIAEEKKTGTIELIATLPLREIDILLGKYFAAVILLLTALLFTFVFPLSIFFLGDIDPGQIFAGYVGVALSGAAFLSMGLLGSCITSNQVIAFIVSFLFTFTIFMAGKILQLMPGLFLPVVQFISLDYHFDSFAKGIIDSRDVLYFITLILLFFLLSVYSLKKDKW